jgi:hypothetical protein
MSARKLIFFPLECTHDEREREREKERERRREKRVVEM